jgi:DNA polymerase
LFDTVGFRELFEKSARKHFKKAIGGNPTIHSASLPLSTQSNGSLIKLGKQLCPGEVCTLHGRRKVFMRGSTDPLIVLIGEAPGAQEEKTGRPFVGRSGKFLDKLLAQAGYRQEYAILNTLLCRPPDNRDPERWEKACCLTRLLTYLDVLKPKGVVCIGRHAAQTFFPIAGIKGESNLPVNCNRTVGAPPMMRFLHIRHPSYYLRNGGFKAKKANIKEEIEETAFVLKLFRELITENRTNKTGWVWLSKTDALLKRELKKGALLVPAEEK